jgi:hypothetical protein
MSTDATPAVHIKSRYDKERIEELRHKYQDEPEDLDWQDIAADDAGVPRFGEI